MIWAWLAHMMPRNLVMQCLYRAINNSANGRAITLPKRKYGKPLTFVSNYNLEDVINDWREVCNGEAREMR